MCPVAPMTTAFMTVVPSQRAGCSRPAPLPPRRAADPPSGSMLTMAALRGSPWACAVHRARTHSKTSAASGRPSARASRWKVAWAMASRMGTTVRSSAGAAWEGASVTK